MRFFPSFIPHLTHAAGSYSRAGQTLSDQHTAGLAILQAGHPMAPSHDNVQHGPEHAMFLRSIADATRPGVGPLGIGQGGGMGGGVTGQGGGFGIL